MLRHCRVREDLRLRFIGGTSDANASDHVVFGGIRVTNRFDVEQRLIRRTGEQQLALTHNQILTIGMEATARNINLSVQPQSLLILHHFQIARQTRFQTKGVKTHVVTDVDVQVAVDRNAGGLRFLGLQIVVKHDHIAGHPYCALRQVVYHDTRPRHIHVAIEGEQAWRGFKDHVRRDIQADHWRYGNTYPTAFSRDARPPVVYLTPVGIAAQVNFSLLRTHHTRQR